ncbi:hypothetical protein RclHR1_23620002 [Rhizophagus clarus]|uniref:Uncharacterized protein n=1 Tax=Rhizophagus clarus TaxID=94130 RepID=A0A2Z6QWT8_9GLOM|nr:hypothetical protein RclHR1_23620002 [Rhizophagus clarus]
MSLNNIQNIVHSLSDEPDKLSEDEEVNLYVYLTGNETVLAEVENLCNRLQTNSSKLKYLRGLSKKSGSGMLLCFSVIFANNTEYLLILVLFFPASYRQTCPKNTFALS